MSPKKKPRRHGRMRLLLVEVPRGATAWRITLAGDPTPWWSDTRADALETAASVARQRATLGCPITLKVKNRGNGRFAEERTYPRSADRCPPRG